MTKLNRNQIKCAAIAAMTLNHTAIALLPEGTPLWILLTDIGYYTAPLMCALLTEGYHYTKDLGAYMKRLFGFALLAQLPYMAALRMKNGNVLFSLLLCLLAVHVLNTEYRPLIRLGSLVLLAAVSALCDWAVILPAMAILFENGRENPGQYRLAWGKILAVYLAATLVQYLTMPYTPVQAILLTFAATAGPAAAAFTILYLYDPSRPAGRYPGKWFFYIYYPAHLTILALIRTAVF